MMKQILAGAWANPHLRYPGLAIGILSVLPKLLAPWPIRHDVLLAITSDSEILLRFLYLYFGAAAYQPQPTPPSNPPKP
jgi:hypothetical protein